MEKPSKHDCPEALKETKKRSPEKMIKRDNRVVISALFILALISAGYAVYSVGNSLSQENEIAAAPISHPTSTPEPILPTSTTLPSATPSKTPPPTETTTLKPPIPTKPKATLASRPQPSQTATPDRPTILPPEPDGRSIKTAISPDPEKTYNLTAGEMKFFKLNDPKTKAAMWADIISGKLSFYILDPENFSNFYAWQKDSGNRLPPHKGMARYSSAANHDVYWDGGNGGYDKSWIVYAHNSGPTTAIFRLKTWSKPPACAGLQSGSYKENLPNQSKGADPIDWGTCDQDLLRANGALPK